MKASDFLRDNIETSGVSGGGNVNKIINSNGRISQRGYGFNFNGTGDYTADRVYCTTSEQIEVRPEMIFSNTEGSLLETFDKFGDGSVKAAYLLNGDGSDLGGNYDATVNGGTFIEDGNYKRWLASSDDDYILISNATDLKTNNITVSMVIKDDGSDDDNQLYFGTWMGGGWKGFNIINNDNKQITLAGGQTEDTNDIRIDTNYSISNNVKTHIVATYDDNKKIARVYINGKLVGEQTGITGIAYDGSDSDQVADDEIVLMGTKDGTYYGSNGTSLSNLVILDRAITEEEVKQLYVESLEYVEQPHIKTTIVDLNNDETQSLVPYQYNFEGQHLYKEIVNEESLAISFDFLATQKGQYSLALVNMTDSDNPKSYVTKFEHNSDVMERITVVVPTKDIGYVRNDEELGCRLYIAGYNTNITTDTEGLQDGEYITLSNSVVPAKGDSIKITNIQVEAGEIATDYVIPDYSTELQRCMRYYEELKNLIWDAGSKYMRECVIVYPKRALSSVVTFGVNGTINAYTQNGDDKQSEYWVSAAKDLNTVHFFNYDFDADIDIYWSAVIDAEL